MNNRFIKLIDINPLSNPSSEKMFSDVLSVVISEFNFKTNSEKLILHWKIFSPTSLIASEIREFIFINCSAKKYDELAKTVYIKSLNKNWKGCSVSFDM